VLSSLVLDKQQLCICIYFLTCIFSQQFSGAGNFSKFIALQVCAHRFTIRGGGGGVGIIWEAGVGRCYLLNSDLRPAKPRVQWTPCIGEVIVRCEVMVLPI